MCMCSCSIQYHIEYTSCILLFIVGTWFEHFLLFLFVVLFKKIVLVLVVLVIENAPDSIFKSRHIPPVLVWSCVDEFLKLCAVGPSVIGVICSRVVVGGPAFLFVLSGGIVVRI